MKTNVIEVHDMLSVLTVDEVEKRFGQVPGVASATVNFAAGNATVRYDETLLEAADIKILVHQRGQKSAVESQGENGGEDKLAHKHAAAPKPDVAPASAAPPESAVPKAATPATDSPASAGKEAKPAPGAPPAPAGAAAHG